MKRKKKVEPLQIIITVICVFMCAICIIPLLNVIALSLSSPDAIMQGRVSIWPVELSTLAYTKVLRTSSFIRAFFFSVFLTLGFTVIAMLMTILAAYPLSKKGLKGGTVIMTLIVFTMYFDVGLIPNYFVVKNLSLLDKISALILPGMLSAYNLIILRNFFRNVDKSIMESAYLDGCSEMGILVHIVLPLSTAVLATLSLFYAVGRWNGVSDAIYYISTPEKYPIQLILREIIKNEQASILDAATETQGQSQSISESVKAASIVLATVPILTVYPFLQKYFTKGVMVGAVKG